MTWYLFIYTAIHIVGAIVLLHVIRESMSSSIPHHLDDKGIHSNRRKHDI